MTCTRRDFVSGAGAIAVVASTGLATSVTLATENEPKKIRYAMVHDETSCIGCTACMDACRTTNKVPEGVSRLEIIRSEPYGEFPMWNMNSSVNLANIAQTHLVLQCAQLEPHLSIQKQELSMYIQIYV